MRRRLVLTLVTAVLILAVVEGGLWLIAALFSEGNAVPKYERAAGFPFYADKEWTQQYWKEFAASGQRRFEPYAAWRRIRFTGKFINVSPKGVRSSWNPQQVDRQKLPRIYVFGGSTVWGSGARDEHTLPSYLSRHLSARNLPAIVTNYGESGYVFRQEVILLTSLLIQGQRPEFVVFYDGVNETYAAYQSGRAGLPQDVARFNTMYRRERQGPWQDLRSGTRKLYRRSKIVQAVGLVPGLLNPRGRFRETASRYLDADLENLAADVVTEYRKTLGFLNGLAQTYRFQYLCVWQPATLSEASLLPAEATNGDPRLQDEKLKLLFRSIYERAGKIDHPRFVDFSRTLTGRDEPLYWDWCHLTEEGNAIVANELADSLEPAVARWYQSGREPPE